MAMRVSIIVVFAFAVANTRKSASSIWVKERICEHVTMF